MEFVVDVSAGSAKRWLNTSNHYGENARKIVPIDSPQFGRVMAVCVGAMMVGTIVTTVDEGSQVKRGDEFGYFAFGAWPLLDD